MIDRIRAAHLLCLLAVLTAAVRGQSLDDLSVVTTILPDIIIDTTNNQPAVNKTSPSTTTTSTAIPDLIVDASSNFRDGQCRNDTHCDQPNQFCKLESNHTDAVGDCVCSKGFLGENCDRISDCTMCTNRSKCKRSTNGTLSCVCRNGK